MAAKNTNNKLIIEYVFNRSYNTEHSKYSNITHYHKRSVNSGIICPFKAVLHYYKHKHQSKQNNELSYCVLFKYFNHSLHSIQIQCFRFVQLYPFVYSFELQQVHTCKTPHESHNAHCHKLHHVFQRSLL